MYGRKGHREMPEHIEPALTKRGTVDWRLVVEAFHPEKVIGNSSIRPLIDLVERVPGNRGPPDPQRARSRDMGTFSRRRRRVPRGSAALLIKGHVLNLSA